jgi:hypothetical protein
LPSRRTSPLSHASPPARIAAAAQIERAHRADRVGINDSDTHAFLRN